MGLKLVAEGVETMGQWRELSSAVVELLQGLLFHKPLPADDATALLSSVEAARADATGAGAVDAGAGTRADRVRTDA